MTEDILPASIADNRYSEKAARRGTEMGKPFSRNPYVWRCSFLKGAEYSLAILFISSKHPALQCSCQAFFALKTIAGKTGNFMWRPVRFSANVVNLAVDLVVYGFNFPAKTNYSHTYRYFRPDIEHVKNPVNSNKSIRLKTRRKFIAV